MSSSKVNYSSTSLGDEVLDARFEDALKELRAVESPIEPHLVGDRVVEDGNLIERFDPCVPGARVSAARAGSVEVVQAAVAEARAAFRGWRAMPYAERTRALRAVAAETSERIAEIAAIVSAETGKTRLEAVGETQEVLDMIEHYCSLMEDNDGYHAVQKSTDTEKNYDVLVPYGVFAVISPFNFPVALTVGMMTGALVTGNTVVLKPSDKTPRSTAEIARIFHSHLPSGVVNIVHGGADTGRALAATDVDGIAFTGSAQVGWDLVETPSPTGIPRPVLAEMGGQNPAIVAVSANLDDAAEGIVRSAFGLSGQKCSACRRVVVVDEVAEALVEKIVARAEALVVGDPLDTATNMGPVIDDAIARRVDDAIEVGRRDGTIRTGGRVPDREGNFFAPTVVTDLPDGHPLTRDELFAPFLAITTVPDFAAALDEANAVEYGLSAGVFSRDEDEVQLFLDDIEAGVVYVNRAAGATTGAWPGVQSFCGWKRSGSSGKGGLGLWYLPGFMKEQSRTIVRAV
ncbi:aldehyde dehydrogenase family protein [Aeromicrobium endophyticum]|uniref:L-glutamate gamma-semialdehyde dehydrogenase n=1 Tax=Aeromicrobium endophyticum TaxID=2292704 RepID=A0A371P8G4_9ACTN|nr:aldehyde dehydrogenase family protein [Aeromicrobium endophyticum]REK72223.1 aldehyde dehydrogenase family protein [Aeromicrobium endophyticum]